MAKDFDNTNQGALFTNKEKDDAHTKWPDYQGELDVEGKKYWLSAWLKKSGSGMSYMSVSVKLKEAKRPESSTSTDERPF